MENEKTVQKSPPRFMEVIDLSVPLKSLDTPVFAGDPPPMKSTWSTLANDGYTTYLWTLGDHAGTHIDAPSHFIESGKSIDEVPISKFVGYGVVLNFANKKPRATITRKDIEQAVKKTGKEVGAGMILLFYTGYTEKSQTDAWMNHPELSEVAAKYIVELGVSSIGVDASSPDHAPFSPHKILLAKNIGIYENLAHLDKLLNKDFLFVGAPLSLVGGSASPVRALAILF